VEAVEAPKAAEAPALFESVWGHPVETVEAMNTMKAVQHGGTPLL
jgi:hypothetical protein